VSPQQQALRIIQDEHRTLTAVVEALNHVAAEVAAGDLTPDYPLLWSLVYYIESFPDRLHHPKEDEVLFPAVRARTRDLDALLDDLSRQHVDGRVHLDRLKTQLGWMEAGIPGAVQDFAGKAAAYAAAHHRHMAQEEQQVIATAIACLTPDDWERVAAAFAENRDPLVAGTVSGDAWFRQLFRRIVTLVPEPWGVGARR
jgi:hemerythrin-like domain-containing protein